MMDSEQVKNTLIATREARSPNNPLKENTLNNNTKMNNNTTNCNNRINNINNHCILVIIL